MTVYVRDLAFTAVRRRLTVCGQEVEVLPFHPVVWISVTAPNVMGLPVDAPRFPAIVDTGATSALTIRERQLAEWSLGNLRAADLPKAGPPNTVVDSSGAKRLVPCLDATVWLHRHPPDSKGLPLDLQALGGILVYESPPDQQADITGPYLPLLGARAFHGRGLNVNVDYHRLLINIGDEEVGQPRGLLRRLWEALY